MHGEYWVPTSTGSTEMRLEERGRPRNAGGEPAKSAAGEGRRSVERRQLRLSRN